MWLPTQHSRMRSAWRRLRALSLGLVLCAVGSGAVSASSLSSASGDSRVTSGHRCRCSHCHSLETCCCAGKDARAKAAEADEARPRRIAVALAGSCLSSAPCGAPVVPVEGSRTVVRLVAALAGNAGPVPATGCSWLAGTSVLFLKSPLAARLDDPPEVSLTSSD